LEPCGIVTEWHTFLAVQAGAAATLTGLVFVAVSLNLNKIMGFAGLPGRAAESILQLIEVFFIYSLALIPEQGSKIMGSEFLVVGAIFWAALVGGQIRYLRVRSGHPWWWVIERAIFGQLAAVPVCVAGIALLSGACDGFYWLVPGFIFSFAAAVASAWVLLVEILR
jgi:hypothetical protein